MSVKLPHKGSSLPEVFNLPPTRPRIASAAKLRQPNLEIYNFDHEHLEHLECGLQPLPPGRFA